MIGLNYFSIADTMHVIYTSFVCYLPIIYLPVSIFNSRNLKLGGGVYIDKCVGGANMCEAQIYISKH